MTLSLRGRLHDRCMVSKAIGEERADDHFHLTMHLVVPAPGTDAVPVFSATTCRHSNNHLVSVGPLLLVAHLDCPYPLPDTPLDAFVLGVLDSVHVLMKIMPQNIVYGTTGKRIPARVLPTPPPECPPLW